MPVRWDDTPQEVKKVGRKQGVPGQLREPERFPLHHLDLFESRVEELLREHWLHQCARQSPR